ncbi:MAG: hypothetical protein EBT15_11795 [Betaproteobacteria bacterium]|nr:hypothetical protein [Betaproteobacteria bacterium]
MKARSVEEDLDDAEVGPAEFGHEPGSDEGRVQVDELHRVAVIRDHGDRRAPDANTGGQEATFRADREAMAW